MTSEPNTVRSWSPDKRQLALLDKYALGYSWHRSAQLAEVPVTTYQRWLAEIPELRAMGDALRLQVMKNLGEHHDDLVRKCYAILERVGDGDGELAPNAPLAKWAERVLGRTVWPVMLGRGLAAHGIRIDGQQALRLIAGVGDPD